MTTETQRTGTAGGGQSSLPRGSFAAAGLRTFASIVMIIIGVFDVLSGVAGVARSAYYAISPYYEYRFSVFGWGLAHIILGALLVVGGLCLMADRAWAKTLTIALDIAVIWAVTRDSREEA
jgi:hypothetical protein